MTAHTNKVIMKDPTTGYTVTQVPATTLTANRTQTLQDTDSPTAVLQNIQDVSAGKQSYYIPNTTAYVEKMTVPQFLDSPHTALVSYKADAVTSSIPRQLLAFGSWTNNCMMDIYIDTSGHAVMGILSALDAQCVTSSSLIDTNWHTYSYTYNGSQISAYIDGLNIGIKTGVSGLTLYSDRYRIGNESSGGGTRPAIGSINRALVFNYTLSEDKIRRYSAGAKLDWSDIGASMTINTSTCLNTYTNSWSYFASASSTGFTSSNATILSDIRVRWPMTIIAGKTYTVSLSYVSPVNVTINSLATENGSYVSVQTITSSFPGSATSVTFIATANAAGIMLSCSTTNTTNGFAITNFNVKQLGAVLDLEPENITEEIWFDTSGNSLNGVVTSALAQRFIPQYASKNYAINGRFEISQRGDFTSPSSITTSTYYLDRFRLNLSGAVTATHQQTTSINHPSGSGYTYRLAVTNGAASSSVRMVQLVEGDRVFMKKTMTLSCWVKSNSSNARISLGSGAIASHPGNDTWQKLSTTLTYNTTGDVSVIIGLISATGGTTTLATGDYIEVADVMFNEGTVAAPFERAGGSIGGELVLCQRYCISLYNSGGTFSRMVNYTANAMTFSCPLPTTMRAAPAFANTITDGTDLIAYNMGNVGQSGGVWSITNTSPLSNAVNFQWSKSSHGLTDGFFVISSSKVVLTSEL